MKQIIAFVALLAVAIGIAEAIPAGTFPGRIVSYLSVILSLVVIGPAVFFIVDRRETTHRRGIDGRWGLRNLCSVLPALIASPAVLVFSSRGLWALLVKSSWWDDHIFVALSWLLGGCGTGVIIRLVFAAVFPERLLPRWFAIVVLGMVTILAARVAWLFGLAAAMSPY
ncbi:MAG: hypothetical protein V3T53_14650 [Phycisphaerales bacterium]